MTETVETPLKQCGRGGEGVGEQPGKHSHEDGAEVRALARGSDSGDETAEI